MRKPNSRAAPFGPSWSPCSTNRREQWTRRAEAGRRDDSGDPFWKATYADRSPAVVRFLYWTEKRSLERMARRIGTVGRMIELGCGPGKWFGLWSHLAAEVHGLDFTRPFAQEAARRNQAAVICGDVRAVPYRDNLFDLALVVKVMAFLSYEDQARALSEVYRILHPGGRCVFLELLGRPDEFSEHVKPRLLEGWVQLARSVGFAVESVEGNEYSPFLRFMERAAHRIKRWWKKAAAAGGEDEGGQPVGVKARRLLRAVESAMAAPSFLLEPVFERVLPSRRAGHGVFLCRKPN